MTENAGEVVIATLGASSDQAQVRRFFDALEVLRKVGKGSAVRVLRVPGNTQRPAFTRLDLMALKEAK